MSDYIVSARKYRPQDFSSVVGQDNIVRTLKNAIKNNKLAQAYLFSGPRGVGKTTCARIFAKTINCEHITPEIEACNECESCKAFNNNTSLNISELDAASNNSVDDIRNLIEQVRIPPQIGKYKIYIIDEVHMLSQQAFNAFLKTLEEPPKHAIFILATTEKHKILPTILSRCQIFDFNRIKIDDIVNHLASIAEREGISYEHDALNIIAQKADGGLRDALSIFDQVASYSNGNITYKAVIENLNILDYDYYFSVVSAALKGDYATALITFNDILEHGFSEANFFNGLASHLRNLLVLKNPSTVKLLEVGEKIKEKYLVQSKETPVSYIFKALDIINQTLINLKTTLNRRLLAEMAIIKLSTVILPQNQESIQSSVPGKKEVTTKNDQSSAPDTGENTDVKKTEQKPEIIKESTATYKKSTGVNIGNLLAGNTVADKKSTAENAGKQEETLELSPQKQEKPEKYFTESMFREAMNKFFNAENLLSLKNADIEISFLPGTIVELILPNSVLKDSLCAHSAKLTVFLHKELSNHKIKLNCKVKELQREIKKPGETKEELYKRMVEKNKLLENLKNDLNLQL